MHCAGGEGTYIRDEGSVYDAPIDVVWTYLLEAGKEHVAAHQDSARFLDAREISDTCSIATVERHIDGRWSKFTSRSTVYPPLAIVNEELEGDLAGSKFVVLYVPQGSQTRVDLVGEFRSETIPESRLSRVVLDLLGQSFDEDVPAVMALLREQRAKDTGTHPTPRRGRGAPR